MTTKQQTFIEEFASLIQKNIKKYGFGNGAVILSQAILESGWGESNLAQHHNYFGIKKASGYDGETINGFMMYPSRELGVAAYFDLMTKDRYKKLHDIYDTEAYIDELINAGYCSDNGYKENLLGVIQRYDLELYFRKLYKEPTYDLVMDVLDGKWGNGSKRTKALESAGYDPARIQDLVNAYTKFGMFLQDVARGDFGFGDTRLNRLEELGVPVELVEEFEELVQLWVARQFV